MVRTIRMALAGNAVTGVDISPPFDDKPDRVPLGPGDKQNVVDPVGAVVIPAPRSEPLVSPAACNRKIPIFDGYTRFDIDLTYVGERSVKAEGYDGPVVVCSARYVPISGHRRDRPATKFMADNKDLEVWLAPIESDHVLIPFRVSVRTMIGTTVVEASEFRWTRNSGRNREFPPGGSATPPCGTCLDVAGVRIAAPVRRFRNCDALTKARRPRRGTSRC